MSICERRFDRIRSEDGGTAVGERTEQELAMGAGADFLPARSLLFVPADDAQGLKSAFRSGADAVVADLEDSVPADRKADGRRILEELLPRVPFSPKLVRINALESDQAAADLDLVERIRVDALVVPKATTVVVEALAPHALPLLAVVESAQGLREAYEIASCRCVVALVLGAFDLSVDLGLETREDASEILYARSKLVVDSVAAGIGRPFDRVYPGTDLQGLEADARLARSLGLVGKACLDSEHARLLNSVFS